jgi:hypothetical protein
VLSFLLPGSFGSSSQVSMVKTADSFDCSFSNEYSDLPPNCKLVGDLFVAMAFGNGMWARGIIHLQRKIPSSWCTWWIKFHLSVCSRRV